MSGEELHGKIAELREQLLRGQITRRQFLVSAALLGFSVSEALALCGLSPTEAAAASDVSAEAASVALAEAEETEGWGVKNWPYPTGVNFIDCDEQLCIGCGMCEMACSMKHFGVINKDLARIQIRYYLLPLPQAIQVTCVQCQEEERECQKACPLDPPAIYFDEDTLHMVIDEERCLGEKCMLCQEACSAKAIRIYPSVSPMPFVCDLCDTENNGDRDPECVKVCPMGALYYRNEGTRHLWRKHGDEKAELLAKKFYPLTKEFRRYPEWRL